MPIGFFQQLFDCAVDARRITVVEQQTLYARFIKDCTVTGFADTGEHAISARMQSSRYAFTNSAGAACDQDTSLF